MRASFAVDCAAHGITDQTRLKRRRLETRSQDQIRITWLFGLSVFNPLPPKKPPPHTDVTDMRIPSNGIVQLWVYPLPPRPHT